MNGKVLGLVSASLLAASSALAQQAAPPPAAPKPTVTGYLGEGYQVVSTEIGTPFIQFVLQKGTLLVWCSVLLQTGETSSCRTIK